MPERVLVVHASLAGETVVAGVTIAELVDRGALVTVLTLARDGGAPSGLSVAEREHAVGAALGILGVVDHRVVDELSAQWAPAIAAVIADIEPDIVVSCDLDDGDERSSTTRAYRAARQAAEATGVPGFSVVTSGPVDLVVDSETAIERKRAALESYVVNASLDRVHDSTIGPERLRRMPPSSAFADLSRGGRVGSLVLAVVLGVATGATVTVAHQASVVLAGVTVPWGIIAALGIAACLVAGLRLVMGSRAVASAAALGLLVGTVVLASPSPGGSVLVPNNVAGYTLLVGTALIVAIALAWPWPRRRAR